MIVLITSVLGQNTRSSKQFQDIEAPDTDRIELNLTGQVVTPNLGHEHTSMTYIVPTNNNVPVTFNSPINWEDRSLHYLVLDNSNNTNDKDFSFSSDYIFLDDPGNTTNTYTVTAGDKQVWFGAIFDGVLQLRVASESTN